MENTLFSTFEKNDWKLSVLGTAEYPLFRADEIAEHLGLVRHRKMVKQLPDAFKRLEKMPTAGGKQAKWLVTEMGLYHLAFRSSKECAEEFQTWASQVVVQIRQQGFYSLL